MAKGSKQETVNPFGGATQEQQTANALIRDLVAAALWAGFTTDDPRDVDYEFGVRAWRSLLPETRETWLRNADNFTAAIRNR